MNATPKKIIGSTLTVVILGIMYYGSYLPYKKSSDFIVALQSRVNSFQDFTDVFSLPLQDPSPIGQGELVRNLGGSVLGIVQNSNGNKDLIDAVIEYLDQYYGPLVGSDRGLNFGQDLYILGAINQTAFEKTGDPKYLEKAEEYYTRGLTLAPKRPQFLYSLMHLYASTGRFTEARKIGDQIVSQWPTDTKTAAQIKSFPSTDATSSVQ